MINYAILISQTVTTVGYGNYGLPLMKDSEQKDLYITCIMIFSGTVLFSKFMAQLNVIFED